MRGDESDEALGSRIRPCLARKVRLGKDRVSGAPLLLYPEGVLWLNATAAIIVALCDGRRTLAEIMAELGDRYTVPLEVLRGEGDEFLDRLRQCGLLEALTLGANGRRQPAGAVPPSRCGSHQPADAGRSPCRASPRALGLL